MTATLIPGALLAGRYRIAEILEEGEMSIVARAVRVADELDVAIKVLHPDLASEPELLERFRRESRALSRLQSEHVVQVLDVIELDAGSTRLPAMVMEYLVGEDLNRVLDEEGPLPLGDATLAVYQACDAIAEAHRCGIVHRDLKPANLFRTRSDDGALHIKVIDFGVAKASVAGEESLTGTGTAMGSPMYMAPEQLRGERVDARADVWALGVTLYELLAGITPFEASVPAMVYAAILTQAPHPLRDERDDVSEELERVILRCLEKEPARRFASAIALREALEDHLTS